MATSQDGGYDAFGRLRTSSPYTVFDSKQLADKQPLYWDDQQTSGSGTTSTYNTNQASTTLAVSNTTAGQRVRQTFRRLNYQPGKGQLVAMTVVFGSSGTGITKRLGIFDSNNGLYFIQTSSGIGIGWRTFTSGSAVDTVVAQSSWNMDKLDGTGLSGVTIDPTKTVIYKINFQWLGVGRVRFGIVFGSRIIYCHEFLNSNLSTLVYMSVPNLPLRYEIVNDGTGAANSVTQICAAVIAEGGQEPTGTLLSADMGATALTTGANTNTYPLLAIRLVPATPYASVAVKYASIMCTSTDPYRWTIVLNPTVTGTALSFSTITNSLVQLATPTNATTISAGTVLFSQYGQSGSGAASPLGSSSISFDTKLEIGQNIAGTSDVLVLAAQGLSGTTETFYGSLTWRETV